MTQLHPLARSVRRTLAVGAIAIGTAGLVACGGGSGSSSGSDSGSLTVGVTDAPVDEADHVYVQFSSITLKPSDAEEDGGDGDGEDDSGDNPAFEEIEFDEPKRIDLLDQQNGDSKLLIENESVPAGDYDWIRLGVDLGPDSTFIEIGGKTFELGCPSCAQTGLKLVSGFSVTDGGSLDLTIDFDLRKSIVETGNSGDDKYKLKPALRLVETDETGEIAVTATSGYVMDRCPDNTDAQSAYVFEGAGVSPDDVDTTDDGDVDPVSTVSLEQDVDSSDFVGTAAFLDEGQYTVAFTCDPENDEPEVDEDNTDAAGNVFFEDTTTVEVNAGQTASYDLSL